MKDTRAAPSVPELRRFGIVTGLMFAAVFGLALPWLFGRPLPAWPWILCAVLVLWGIVHPASLGPVHRAWMAFALVFGRINDRIILSVVFVLVILPAGLARRLLGGDPMARRLDGRLPTYRTRSTVRPPKSFERPF